MKAKPTLTTADFCRAAERLRSGVAEIMAVAEVESRGAGFYADGFPVILFERHKFRDFTKGRYNNSHPSISGPAGNYGKGGVNQRRKFNIAFALDPEAAMKACSWGKFQIMGFNHKVCGFNTVGAFVDAMKESEGRQLDAFVSFVIGNKLAAALRTRDWPAFARGYNGPKYAQNQYDIKMAAAYRKFAKMQIDCSKVKSEPKTQTTAIEAPIPPRPIPASPEQPVELTVEQTDGESTVRATERNEQSVVEVAQVEAPQPQGVFSKLTAGIGTLFAGTAVWQGLERLGAMSLSTQAIAVICFVVLIGFLGFCFWAALDAWKNAQKVRVEAESRSDIHKKDIEWV